MKPLILLTAGYEKAATGLDRRYLYQNYADAIVNAGGIPLLPLDNGEFADDLFKKCHGLLLTGGPDIDPVLFGEQKLPECGKIDAQRDAMEYKLLTRFVEGKKPVFGICRGIQVINAFFGGTLWQDLPSQLGVVHGGVPTPHDCVHMTDIAAGSWLETLYGQKMQTNSYHHQSIKRMADGFVAAAQSGTVIEAMAHTELPISAVQWHPERMTGADRYMHHGPDSAPLFRYFVKQCEDQI